MSEWTRSLRERYPRGAAASSMAAAGGSTTRADAEENTVVKEFRKGYMLRERVIRAALVGVAVKPSQSGDTGSEATENQSVRTEE